LMLYSLPLSSAVRRLLTGTVMNEVSKPEVPDRFLNAKCNLRMHFARPKNKKCIISLIFLKGKWQN
jgi:hypothetical protein